MTDTDRKLDLEALGARGGEHRVELRVRLGCGVTYPQDPLEQEGQRGTERGWVL